MRSRRKNRRQRVGQWAGADNRPGCPVLDEHPDGRAYLLGTAVQRVSLVDRDPAKVKLTLPPIEIELGPGHRVVLQITTAAFPRYPATARSSSGELTVHLGGTHPTVLNLPIHNPVTVGGAVG